MGNLDVIGSRTRLEQRSGVRSRAGSSIRSPAPAYIRSVTSVKIAILWTLAVGAGIAAGLWMASATNFCTFCLVAPRRFATWECSVVGFLVSAAVLGAILAFERDFLRESIVRIHRLTRFLFEDLTQRQT